MFSPCIATYFTDEKSKGLSALWPKACCLRILFLRLKVWGNFQCNSYKHLPQHYGHRYYVFNVSYYSDEEVEGIFIMHMYMSLSIGSRYDVFSLSCYSILTSGYWNVRMFILTRLSKWNGTHDFMFHWIAKGRFYSLWGVVGKYSHTRSTFNLLLTQ